MSTESKKYKFSFWKKCWKLFYLTYFTWEDTEFSIVWIFVSLSKFICLSLFSNVMIFGYGAFERAWVNESGVLMNKLSDFIKETALSSLASFTMWRRHREKTTVCEWVSGLSPDIGSAGNLILTFSASIIVRNKCLFFNYHSVCDIFATITQTDKTKIDAEKGAAAITNILRCGSNFATGQFWWKNCRKLLSLLREYLNSPEYNVGRNMDGNDNSNEVSDRNE